jgi:arylsulfatase A-like enzyme
VLQAAAAFAGPVFLQPRRTRPNIVLIIADDLAAWMLGCYGNRKIRTPNIDRLASEGVRFENGFVCSPICSPSRATLMTGRIPPQTGIHDWLTENAIAEPPQGQAAIPDSWKREVFISDLLREAGYQCGYSGKWHLGDEGRPQHGYTFWYVQDRPNRYQDPNMIRGTQRLQETGYLADLIHSQAIQFLDQARRQTAPWFLTLSHFNPHTPYAGHPRKYYEMYAAENFDSFGFEPRRRDALREAELMTDPVGNMRGAAAATTALDDRIGEFMDYLDTHRLSQNTMILFVGDNGYLHGRHGLWSKGESAWPPVMYEEVMKVPTVWRWPGTIPATISRELVSFYDVLPTLCELAGVPAPPGDRICGLSYAPLLRGERLSRRRDRVYGYLRNTYCVRGSRYKYVMRNQGFGPNELWDLEADPTEHHNLIHDPSHQERVRELRQDLVDWLTRHGEKWATMSPQA